jgi:hypothetical protein
MLLDCIYSKKKKEAMEDVFDAGLEETTLAKKYSKLKTNQK